ncbi:MAG: sulfurtransferase [Gammaproteobacteria bacterium]|nr:sulfurtransferase [Gammaproteobacteria bacterium]
MDYTTLISCAEASKHLKNKGWRFIDCRFDLMNPDAGCELYQTDHIAGAVYAHLDEDLSSDIGPHTGRHPLPNVAVLVEQLCKWGIGNQTQVVVYDNNIGMFASRLWWLLRWLGHDKVAVLDGGYMEWKDKGYPLSSEIPEVTPATFTPDVQEGWIVSAEQIPDEQQHGKMLLDARAAERYRGDVEPIDTIAGHIPGALNYPLIENINEEGLFKERTCLREQINAVIGEHGGPQVIHYCGSGVSACHNILAMEVAGLHGSRLYPGSWSEWIRDSNRGVAVGDDK